MSSRSAPGNRQLGHAGLTVSWKKYRDGLAPATSTRARLLLAERFSGAVSDHPDLARAVGCGMRDEPLYRAVAYKEAFSAKLVRDVLAHLGVSDGSLLDPFAGVGTSLLVASECGMRAVGVDILPYSAFVSNTLLRAPLANWIKVRRHLQNVLAAPPLDKGMFPDFPVREWAFMPAALAELSRIHGAVAALPGGLERDVLRLAALSVIEESSQATKDGTSLRRRPQGTGRPGRYGTRRTRVSVARAFVSRLNLLEADAGEHPVPDQGSRALVGDARCLTEVLGDEKFTVSIFSPPYPNRYDYSANYQLELGFGFIAERDSLRKLRRSQLRSHLECPWPDERTISSDALDEFLAALLAARRKADETGRVFRMVVGYFEDMRTVLAGLAKVMRPGSPIAVVVGTQVFGGQELPTDLLLAEIAEREGFAVKALWVARTKGVAVQQRARFGVVPASRETVLILEA